MDGSAVAGLRFLGNHPVTLPAPLPQGRGMTEEPIFRRSAFVASDPVSDGLLHADPRFTAETQRTQRNPGTLCATKDTTDTKNIKGNGVSDNPMAV